MEGAKNGASQGRCEPSTALGNPAYGGIPTFPQPRDGENPFGQVSPIILNENMHSASQCRQVDMEVVSSF